MLFIGISSGRLCVCSNRIIAILLISVNKTHSLGDQVYNTLIKWHHADIFTGLNLLYRSLPQWHRFSLSCMCNGIFYFAHVNVLMMHKATQQNSNKQSLLH